MKLKEYYGENDTEYLFLLGLFSKQTTLNLLINESMNMKKNSNKFTENILKDVTEKTQWVTLKDLKNNFHETLTNLLTKLNRNKEKIFELNSLNKTKYLIIMIILIFFIINYQLMMESDLLNILFTVLFTGTSFILIFGSLIGLMKIPKVLTIIYGIGFGIIPWIINVFPCLLLDSIYISAYIIGLISVIILLFFIKHMPRRNNYGNEILGKIKGFRNFLKTAKKPKLEELVLENPSYFYNILPFTYVLGVSNKWIKKFKNIGLKNPNCWGETGEFNSTTFRNSMRSTVLSASSAMSSAPSSGGESSGGGSSGGGSSGGGSGGGGAVLVNKNI